MHINHAIVFCCWTEIFHVLMVFLSSLFKMPYHQVCVTPSGGGGGTWNKGNRSLKLLDILRKFEYTFVLGIVGYVIM